MPLEAKSEVDVKSCVIMAWHNLSVKDMTLVKKDDIIKENDKFFLKHNEIKIPLEEVEYRVLKRLAGTDTYVHGKRTQRYVKSDYLLRKTIRGGILYQDEPMPTASIRRLVSNFNARAAEFRRKFALEILSYNGVFTKLGKVYKDKTKSVPYHIIRSWTGCGKGTANQISKKYKIWQELYQD